MGAFSEDAADTQLVGAMCVFVEVAEDFDGVVAVVFADLAAAERWRGRDVEHAVVVESRPVLDAKPRRVSVAMQEVAKNFPFETEAAVVLKLKQVLDNPEAYARRLIGIDEALERRIGDETKILANPNTPLEQRKAAESVINVITNFRQTLGVPQKVKSKEEAMKLPPGTEFIDPNGVVRVVPGAR